MPEVRRKPPVCREFRSVEQGNAVTEIMAPPGGFHAYLIRGGEKALLIDTGMGVGSISAYVKTLTDLPVELLITHAHPDHAGGCAEFNKAMLNPADLATAAKMASLEFRKDDLARILGGEEMDLIDTLQPDFAGEWVPLADGQEIDLGGRILKVFFTPGHTLGSVCVYDTSCGYLFAGDTVQPNLGMVGDFTGNVPETLAALRPLQELNISKILCGHAMPESVHNGKELLSDVCACLEGILDGSLIPEDMRGNMRFTYGKSHVMCRKDNCGREA